MAKRNYREIQEEYLRRTAFEPKTAEPSRYSSYSTRTAKVRFKDLIPEPVAEMMQRLSQPTENGCHSWLGKIGTGGYAYCAYRQDGRRFHRKAAIVAYELKNGPVPEGKEVSHSCNNRKCVNPDHLLAETHSENLRRRKPWRWALTCKHCGGPKEQVPNAGRNPQWTCIPCRAKRSKEWREKTGYDYSKYRAENADRINAKRRTKRNLQKYLSVSD